MFKILDNTKENIIAIQVEGEITRHDYEKINPLIDKTIREYNQLKFLILMGEIDAIKPEAFIKDVKIYLNSFNKIEKVAIVGNSSWQKLLAGISSPFISGKLKFFQQSQIMEAQSWLGE